MSVHVLTRVYNQFTSGCFRFDISCIISDALYAYKNTDAWVKSEKAAFDFNSFPFSPKIHKQAKGVVLIISPFNYPLWCLGPIVSTYAMLALHNIFH